MTALKNHARFATNNYLDAPTLSSSGDLSGFPASNLYHPLRSKLWKPSNVFEIHEKNCKVYIDSTTYTMPTGSYSLTTLSAAFNVLTGGFLIRGDGGLINMTFGASKTVNFSSQTDAIWTSIGFIGTTDKTGTAFVSDEPIYNTGAWVKVDLKLPQEVTFSAVISEANAVFGSCNAEIRLQGNNLDTWIYDLPVDVALDVGDTGAFVAPNDLEPCRFWRLLIKDTMNENVKIAKAYIGDTIVCQKTNIATGFTRQRDDQSVKLFSESGASYADFRPKVLGLSSVGMQYLEKSELIEIEQLFYDLGVQKPFYLCIDPSLAVSSSLSEMTHYVEVISPLQLQHVLRGYYNLSVELKEVL